MTIHILDDKDVSHLDKTFKGKGGLIVPVSFEKVRAIPRDELLIYCYKNGIYQVITEELVQVVRGLIVGQALEIGCGNGTLGRALGIPRIDLMAQINNPTVKAQYELARQPVIKYPPDVEELDYLDAIIKYQPSTVVGAWVTAVQKLFFGFDFYQIMRRVERIIYIGNAKTHGEEIIIFQELGFKIKATNGPFLVSRGDDKKNFIFTLEK